MNQWVIHNKYELKFDIGNWHLTQNNEKYYYRSALKSESPYYYSALALKFFFYGQESTIGYLQLEYY